LVLLILINDTSILTKELGIEKDDKDELLTKYYEKIENFRQRKISKVILKTIEDEMKKLEMLEKNSPEFNVTRSYLGKFVFLYFYGIVFMLLVAVL
jgi:Lon-like ATP-dependent protease